ncbi:MAG: HesA/MoeB/ThiF family protein [Candidatus Micropelagos sp.]|uniref:Molybdopterin-synthase adenylyltransferase n=1 Tax=PS1 clade bacterium TaxID=2175152 RepID=A0A368EMS6_9PROT|nr:adenylyltransferase [Hyphomicrobiales bacterium]OUV49882.1 MAG: adenylyltransferase [Alphaproteobacteria bacterium TMED110]RCL85434.1 MAG: HesA/MoeB/ThiF family protein [PS1 clade bacterium]
MTGSDGLPENANYTERYARHLVLKEIGGAGQQKLSLARVLVIGAGGLGASLLAYLSAAGVGSISIIDDDVVSLSNLQRQVLFNHDDIGRPKAVCAAKFLSKLNPDCKVTPIEARLTADNAKALIDDHDVIADGCDNFATRFLVNDACYFAAKPLVSAAVGRFDGQLTTFKAYMKDTNGTPYPCYRSLVPDSMRATETDDCSTTGIIGALTGIMGSLQALEVVKEITGAGDSLAGRLMIYDGLAATARVVGLPWDPSNPLNGNSPTISDLSSHS